VEKTNPEKVSASTGGCMLGGIEPHYDCIKVFSETDFTGDLKKIDIPMLFLHGDDDQIVPIAASAPLSARLPKNATLTIYPGYPQGMPATHRADQRGLAGIFRKQESVVICLLNQDEVVLRDGHCGIANLRAVCRA
jgi:hypothetical protein